MIERDANMSHAFIKATLRMLTFILSLSFIILTLGCSSQSALLLIMILQYNTIQFKDRTLKILNTTYSICILGCFYAATKFDQNLI